MNHRQGKKLVPSNCICECDCHNDPEVVHSTPCCFTCPKCKQNIITHLYNVHVHTCSRANLLQQNQPIENPEKNTTIEPTAPARKRKPINRPTIPGSTRTRYRKR